MTRIEYSLKKFMGSLLCRWFHLAFSASCQQGRRPTPASCEYRSIAASAAVYALSAQF